MRKFTSTLGMAIAAVACSIALAGEPIQDVVNGPSTEPEGAFELHWTGLCPGEVTLTAGPSLPGERVAFAYGTTLGSTPVPNCPGLTLEIAGAKLLRIVTADDAGMAHVSGFAPAGACGRIYIQAVNLSACVVSNTILLGVDDVPLDLVPEVGNRPAKYCLYTALEDCAALRINLGDTICVLCEDGQTDCHGAIRQVFKIYSDYPDCKNLVCELEVRRIGNCQTCYSRHKFQRCP